MKGLSKLLSVSFLIFASSLFAKYDPNWERPIQKANMTKLSAKGEFATSNFFTLTLTKRDGEKKPTGIVLVYKTQILCFHGNCPSNILSYELEIAEINNIGCGSVEYVANLKNQDPANSERVTVVLKDHTKRLCMDLQPVWAASVVKGYGWCGTGDSTADLEGKPEYVVTIQ